MTSRDDFPPATMADSSCLGWMCCLRDRCALHKLPAVGRLRHFLPHHPGEHCPHFKAKPEPAWGTGPETHRHD